MSDHTEFRDLLQANHQVVLPPLLNELSARINEFVSSYQWVRQGPLLARLP
jgi:hypothetical protein